MPKISAAFPFILCLAAACLFGQACHAQYNDSTRSQVRKGRLRGVIIGESAFYVAGNAFLQFIWYRNHEPVPFHFYNDSKGWLQLDKCGHFYSAYYESYGGYSLLRWAGVSQKKALIYGGPLGLVLQTPIEVFDGLYEGYGFSTSDMVANTLGAALFTVQQAWVGEQVVRPKFSYSPSPYSQYLPYYLGENAVQSFFMDYNGHTYWLSANLKKITGLHALPPWLNVAFGYSGNGMLAEFKNPLYFHGKAMPQLERTRQYLFSLDVDSTRIKTHSAVLKGIFQAVNLLKVPFPALEYNKEEGLRMHALYF